MSRDTVVSLIGAGLFALWFVGYSAGERNWLVTAGGYVFGIVFGLTALGVVIAVILWVLKALGVIARLPWTLDKKLNDPS
ncbi:MAG: hypothetical protein EPN20_04910 [Magnetospirillum sp.]|nr:MAG: hypothetical protein EPN20_04910 [Magnetospirillum sp.]